MSVVRAGIQGQMAARVAAGLCSIVAGFQVVLAAGAPFGRIAFGGGQVELSEVLRTTAGGAAVLWAGAVGALLAYSGDLAGGRLRGARGLRPVLVAVAVISSVGVLMNLASPSMWERIIWTPVALATAVLTVVALRPVEPPPVSPS